MPCRGGGGGGVIRDRTQKVCCMLCHPADLSVFTDGDLRKTDDKYRLPVFV